MRDALVFVRMVGVGVEIEGEDQPIEIARVESENIEVVLLSKSEIGGVQFEEFALFGCQRATSVEKSDLQVATRIWKRLFFSLERKVLSDDLPSFF